MIIYVITEVPDDEYGYRHFVDITKSKEDILKICEKHFTECHNYTNGTTLRITKNNNKVQVSHFYGKNLQYWHSVYDITEREI